MTMAGVSLHQLIGGSAAIGGDSNRNVKAGVTTWRRLVAASAGVSSKWRQIVACVAAQYPVAKYLIINGEKSPP